MVDHYLGTHFTFDLTPVSAKSTSRHYGQPQVNSTLLHVAHEIGIQDLMVVGEETNTTFTTPSHVQNA